MRSVPLRLAAALLALAPTLGCGGSTDLPASTVPSGVPFQELVSTARACRPTARRELVLSSQADWEKWWAEVTCGEPPAPSVDFTARVVIAIEDDLGPNGCYGAAIEAIVPAEGGGYRVEAVRRVPGPEDICTQIVVQPAFAVAVTAPRGAVEFAWTTRAAGRAR